MAEVKPAFGHLETFNPDSETIAAYLEQVELFLQANAVTDEKKVAVFLSVIVFSFMQFSVSNIAGG